jgi:short-subunit dehydrogenase
LTEVTRPVALVTGASSGIGAALAEQIARSGSNLILVGRDATRLNKVAARSRALGVNCRTAAFDIRDRAAFVELVEESQSLGPITLFISNAGILDGRREGEVIENAESAHLVLDTNLLAAIDALHCILPGMCARGTGQILLVSSLAAFAPLADAPAYSASKSGLLSYGLALREALRSAGVSVTVACPGYVATRMAALHLGNRPWEISSEQAAAQILAAVRKRKALCGFPRHLYWSSRISLLIPERIRYLFTKGLRFYVGRK